MADKMDLTCLIQIQSETLCVLLSIISLGKACINLGSFSTVMDWIVGKIDDLVLVSD